MDISTLSLQTETLDSTLLPRILTPEAGLIVARAKETLPRTITPFFSTIAAFLATRSLNFRLTGILYTEQLQNVSSDEYLRLAREVKLVMNKIFSSRYPEGYMQCYVGSFLNGSVIVKAYVSFNNRLPAPSSSDVVRSVVTDIKAKQTYFGWNIDPHSVESHGRTLKNLEPEMFSVSLLVLHCGFIVTSQMSEENISLLENLKQEVIFSFPGSINVSNFSISSVRDVLGDLEVKGNLYLNSTVHTDVQSLLQAFTPLSNKSVDLSSVNVDGHYMNLQVFPIRFQITNKPFVVNLLDLSSSEFQDLSKDLSAVVMSVLSITKPLQVIIREVMRGSVLCKGVVVYQLPAPGSGEILRAFLGSLDSNGMFKSSSYKVDRYSLQVGDSSPEPHFEYPSFPGFGVAIIVMCGLSILIFPTLAYVCFRTKMLGHKKKATIQRCLDPDRQSRHFEMDNQAFRASIEQP
ncbi:hypothetical protein GDO86_006198 [Hymenochirus boettgeri]|uniref:SEA domain-containing protein n=1 Tax=Hymenochirus boettgeri TaxID=247094 RepID=A0A8T2JA60_9PIPI|nr:hypothetical protein GDO86_006198 [Hymenochirus boettgeri]